MDFFKKPTATQLLPPYADQGVGADSVENKDDNGTPLITDYTLNEQLHASLNALNEHLRDLSKTFVHLGSIFPTTKMYKWGLAGYAAATATQLSGFPAPNKIVTATLNGKPIRSVYIENNGATNAQTFFEGSEGGSGGQGFTTVSKGTWRVCALDDDNFAISCQPIADTGLLYVVVTDAIWKPAMGAIV